jgi:hypothetical protein
VLVEVGLVLLKRILKPFTLNGQAAMSATHPTSEGPRSVGNGGGSVAHCNHFDFQHG